MQHSDGMILELVHHLNYESVALPPLPELLHIGFSVSNIQEALTQLGDVEIIKPITHGISVKEFCFIRDPNGFPVELSVEK